MADHWTFYGYSIIAPLSVLLPTLIISLISLILRLIFEKTNLIKSTKVQFVVTTILLLLERISFMIAIYMVSMVLAFAVALNELHTLYSYLVLVIVQAGLFHAFRYDGPSEVTIEVGGEEEDEENGVVNEVPDENVKTSILEKIQAILMIYPASLYNGMKKNSKSFILLSFFLLVFNSVALISMSGICFCLFPIEISSSLTRILMGSTCKDNEICLVYLNVGEKTTSEMIVKFHTKLPFSNTSSIYFDSKSHPAIDDYPNVQNCFTDDLRDIITDETRYIHTCFLTGLSSSSEYYFRVGDEKINSKEKKFKTANDGENVIIASGDASYSDTTTKLIKMAATHSPSFFMIGGDIFYTNGMNVNSNFIYFLQTCYQRLDKFFKIWEEVAYTPQGHYIPLLTSIGNHEAKDFLFEQTRNEIQLYLRYLSFKHGDYGKKTSLFHAHTIGNHSSIMVLDSGVVETHESQIEWLTNSWNDQKYNNTHKYTLYHAPLYPSARALNDKMSSLGRKHWLKLFDDNRVRVSFENHDHMLKRSKFLKNDKEDVSGTVYVGDGSLGTPRQGSVSSMPWYLETRKSVYHVWVATMNRNSINLKAKDEDGKVEDELTINF